MSKGLPDSILVLPISRYLGQVDSPAFAQPLNPLFGQFISAVTFDTRCALDY